MNCVITILSDMCAKCGIAAFLHIFKEYYHTELKISSRVEPQRILLPITVVTHELHFHSKDPHIKSWVSVDHIVYICQVMGLGWVPHIYISHLRSVRDRTQPPHWQTIWQFEIVFIIRFILLPNSNKSIITVYQYSAVQSNAIKNSQNSLKRSKTAGAVLLQLALKLQKRRTSL